MVRFVLTLSVLALSMPALAQSAPARGWLDVNLVSMRSTQGEQVYTTSEAIFGEVATATSAYPELSTAKALGLDVGLLIRRRIGVGLSYGGVDYGYPVGLGVSIPHPLFFDRSAVGVDVTPPDFERRDRSVDISAVYVPPTPDAWRIHLFGGPTRFSVTQDMVEVISADQRFGLNGDNVVNVSTFTEREVQGSAWGFHAGADVAYFFSRHVGIGGVFRANRGTVTIDREPLTLEPINLRAGRTTAGMGLRFRF